MLISKTVDAKFVYIYIHIYTQFAGLVSFKSRSIVAIKPDDIKGNRQLAKCRQQRHIAPLACGVSIMQLSSLTFYYSLIIQQCQFVPGLLVVPSPTPDETHRRSLARSAFNLRKKRVIQMKANALPALTACNSLCLHTSLHLSFSHWCFVFYS